MNKITIYGLAGTPIEISGLTRDNILQVKESFLESINNPSKQPFTDIRYLNTSNGPQQMIIPARAIGKCICVFQIAEEEIDAKS